MMRLNILKMIILSGLFLQNAFAGMEGFEKRFELIRQDGNVIEIHDRTLMLDVSMEMMIQFIIDRLLKEQSLLSLKSSDYDNDIRQLFDEDFSDSKNKGSGEEKEHVNRIIRSLKKLSVLKVQDIFNNPDFRLVLNTINKKLKKSFHVMNPKVVASLNNSKFFYRRNQTAQIIKWGLKFAKKKLRSVPLLNTAIYLILQLDQHLSSKLLYHQNILLYYLENATEEELQMTPDEVNRAISSIYESRIPGWFGFMESRNAQDNWNSYGIRKFYGYYRSANSFLRKNKALYDSVDERLNFAFQKVVFNGDSVIINLFNNGSVFSKAPAVTFYNDHPTKVLRKRVILQLAQLGMSFLPMPNWLSDSLETYIKSHYEKQRITEGVLIGYFEHNDNSTFQNYIRAQSLLIFNKDL